MEIYSDAQLSGIQHCLPAVIYHFSEGNEGANNPFSLLGALFSKKLMIYRYATGTLDFLVKRLSAIGYDISKFTNETLYQGECCRIVPMIL